MRLLQEAFVIFVPKQTWQFRSFGCVCFKCCASSILLPLLQDDPSLIPENCVRVQAILWPLDYLWNPLTRMVDLPTDRPHSSSHRSEIPTSVSWWLVRHFALKLNPKMNLMQPGFQRPGVHLVPTIPVVAL